jgi:hypothetical protein
MLNTKDRLPYSNLKTIEQARRVAVHFGLRMDEGCAFIDILLTLGKNLPTKTDGLGCKVSLGRFLAHD